VTRSNPGVAPARTERPPREASERRTRTTLRVRGGGSDRTPETVVSTPAKHHDPTSKSPAVEAILAALNSRAATFTPGTLVGAGVYLETRQVWQALLACVLGPPAVASGRVLAEWVRLLEPPKRWRRPRRRGG
jgi:hypothetical protein